MSRSRINSSSSISPRISSMWSTKSPISDIAIPWSNKKISSIVIWFRLVWWASNKLTNILHDKYHDGLKRFFTKKLCGCAIIIGKAKHFFLISNNL
jgi:hypothetical protein